MSRHYIGLNSDLARSC